jgi:hypothetical protein
MDQMITDCLGVSHHQDIHLHHSPKTRLNRALSAVDARIVIGETFNGCDHQVAGGS